MMRVKSNDKIDVLEVQSRKTAWRLTSEECERAIGILCKIKCNSTLSDHAITNMNLREENVIDRVFTNYKAEDYRPCDCTCNMSKLITQIIRYYENNSYGKRGDLMRLTRRTKNGTYFTMICKGNKDDIKGSHDGRLKDGITKVKNAIAIQEDNPEIIQVKTMDTFLAKQAQFIPDLTLRIEKMKEWSDIIDEQKTIAIKQLALQEATTKLSESIDNGTDKENIEAIKNGGIKDEKVQ